MNILEKTIEKLAKGKEIRLNRQAFDELVSELKKDMFKFVPPGHFYSPIPDINDAIAYKDKIWKNDVVEVVGIEINTEEQYANLIDFFDFAETLPFSEGKTEGLRYYYQNESYSFADAITLHCMIRKYKPKKIIEVGSGHSSCVMLDTNELFFNNKIEFTFIEPFPEYFFSLITERDKKKNKIIADKIQNIPLNIFETLNANDILFIDSSHVSKVNSDVNTIFFEILPRLKKGVIVHFHDIFFPFEYPYGWILEGRAWNEAYLLRAFMQFNGAFEIIFMSTYVCEKFKHDIEEHLPIFLKNSGGNFWIRKK